MAWILKNLLAILALALGILNYISIRDQSCREARTLIEGAYAMVGGNSVAIDILRYDKTQLDEVAERARLARSKCDDTRADSYWIEGHVLSAEGRKRQALGRFEQAIAIHPDDSRYAISRAITLGKLRRSGEAIDVLRHIILESPSNASALCALGTLLRDTGHLDEAIYYYDQSIRAGFPYAPVRKAELLLKTGERDKALQTLSLCDPGLPLPDWVARKSDGGYIINSESISPGSGGFPQPASLDDN